jgi:hypothetical protein
MEEANKATLDPIPDSWPDHYSANDRIVAEIKKKSGVASVDDLMF